MQYMNLSTGIYHGSQPGFHSTYVMGSCRHICCGVGLMQWRPLLCMNVCVRFACNQLLKLFV